MGEFPKAVQPVCIRDKVWVQASDCRLDWCLLGRQNYLSFQSVLFSFCFRVFGAHFCCLRCSTTFPDKSKQNHLSEGDGLAHRILPGEIRAWAAFWADAVRWDTEHGGATYLIVTMLPEDCRHDSCNVYSRWRGSYGRSPSCEMVDAPSPYSKHRAVLPCGELVSGFWMLRMKQRDRNLSLF